MSERNTGQQVDGSRLTIIGQTTEDLGQALYPADFLMEMRPAPEYSEAPTLSFIGAFTVRGAVGKKVLANSGVAFLHTLMIADGEPFDAKIFQEVTGYDAPNMASNLTNMSKTFNRLFGAEVITRQQDRIRQSFTFRMGAVALRELRPRKDWPAVPKNLRGLSSQPELWSPVKVQPVEQIVVTRPKRPKSTRVPAAKPATREPEESEALQVRPGDDKQRVMHAENPAAKTDWRKRAACKDEDPELFFPVGSTGPSLLQTAEAKAVCRRCPAVSDCLEWALEAGESAGVWGGMSADERQALKQRNAEARAKTS